MTQTFTCGDHGALVSYLYDECDPNERRAISAHVAVCGGCAEERLLTYVPRILLTTDDAIGQGINRPFPSEDELIETLGIAANRFGDELVVGQRHVWSRGPAGPVSG